VGPVVRLRIEGLDAALAMSRRGPLQIEAAISAMHCRAHSAAETDWKEIAALYGLLEELRPIPAVRVNRAFALAKAERPKPGLALLDDKSLIDASSYPYVHLVRGTLLAELGRIEEARASLYQARRVSRNSAEAAQIEDQIARLEGSAT
jgi:RNA polymerase sigma-70 factor (ECF subfamily)